MPPTESLRARLATRANALTGVRLALAPLLAWAVCAGAHALALACFVLAVGTDLADGRVARRFGEESALGGFLDHATDALFVASGLGALAVLGLAPAALPALVLAAFASTLDSRPLQAARCARARSGAATASPTSCCSGCRSCATA
jgi:phosphatidylglycerophosphate synthase